MKDESLRSALIRSVNIKMGKLKNAVIIALLALALLVFYYFLSGKGFGLNESNWDSLF